MAEATSFDESNGVLDRPKDMTEEQCDPLSVAFTETSDGIPFVISCWKVTKKELEEINRTGRIWLGIVGNTMPPVFVTGEKPLP